MASRARKILKVAEISLIVQNRTCVCKVIFDITIIITIIYIIFDI